jgi:hypothetical protein
MLGLVAFVAAAQAAAAPAGGSLTCSAYFLDGGRSAYVSLGVDGAYTPHRMAITLHDRDGWTRTEISLDPAERRLPGAFAHGFFAVRFTGRPVFPLTMTAYADGRLRWRETVRVPFWPATLIGAARAGRGTTVFLGRAEDGLPVATPREIEIVLTDARGRRAGSVRYPLVTGASEERVRRAIADVETALAARRCLPPAPPLH